MFASSRRLRCSCVNPPSFPFPRSPQNKLVDLIMERHSIAGTNGLNLYLGELVDEAAIVRPEEYNLSLADVKGDGRARSTITCCR